MARAKTKTPDALKLKTCKKKVKIKGEPKECGREYLGDLCPQRDVHLLPMVTGFCSNGFCEGTKATDWRGRPVRTCSFIVTCPCKCHADLDKLFAMTDKERIEVDVSGYTPPPRDFLMPEDRIPVPADVPGVADGLVDTPAIESPAPGIVPPRIARDYDPTTSGRTTKGQLESWVHDACDVWVIDKPGFPCTPTWVANEIAGTQGVTHPSVGAIDSVFKRWEKLGFAIIQRQPTRFVGYTEEGLKTGLDKMKAKLKRQKKLQTADDRRNLRR